MKIKFLSGLLFVTLWAIGIVLVLAHENTLGVHPKGIIAKNELALMITNILLMLSIIVPTYIFLFSVIWRYCIKNKNAPYDPDHSHGFAGEVILWALPTIVVIIMAFITWEATYALNPYKPIESDNKPLKIQVIALNWKWLFIYPEQGIATINYIQIPERTPIHFQLTADNSPMNSFWIPQLGGQIYSMAGMTTQLYLMADEIGEYTGRAVEINGEGYADMVFKVKSTSLEEFENWVNQVKKSPKHLDNEAYQQLVKPFIEKSVILFSDVEDNLYHKIVHKYMYPTVRVL
jgi:cytochrome o ubiquinol oxidase subunit 2